MHGDFTFCLPFLYQSRSQLAQVVDRALKTLPFLYQNHVLAGKANVRVSGPKSGVRDPVLRRAVRHRAVTRVAVGEITVQVLGEATSVVVTLMHTLYQFCLRGQGGSCINVYHYNMKTTTNKTIRELRRILGQTQGEFAALIGASKDTVASWDTGRNPVSASMARRIALVTGVDERSLLKPGGELMVRLTCPRRRYTMEEFGRYRKQFWGASGEESVRRQWRPCADTLELVFLAAVKGEMTGGRLPGVVDSFIQWCRQAREEFQLGPAIEAELATRQGTL